VHKMSDLELLEAVDALLHDAYLPAMGTEFNK